MAQADHRDTSFFDTVKEKVPLEQYLQEHCNVEFVSDGPGRLAACCPFHAESTPSFKVRESDEHPWQMWRCYGGCAGSELDNGTIIDAVMKREGFSEAMDAARWVNEEYNLGLNMNHEAYNRFQEIRQKARGRIEEGQRELEKGESIAAKAAKAYFERRGFIDETSLHFGLGVDTEMTKAGRLSIPLFDKENHPVSIDGRSLFDSHPCQACGADISAKEVSERRFAVKKAEEKGETPEFDWTSCPRCGAPDAQAKIKFLASQHPKYRFEKGLDKSKLLYHQFETKKALVQDGRKPLQEQHLHGLFLSEGYADCWAGWQGGQRAICSYNGSILSDWQAKQACEVAMSSAANPKPIILIPDMDATGILNVERNINKLHSINPNCEVQVIFGINDFTYKGKDGEEKTCKDLGEVLENFGTEAVTRLLRDNRRPAEEWIIRNILDARLADGSAFHSQLRQMELIAEILMNVRHKTSLDHLVPVLAARWEIREQDARRFFQMNHSQATTASHQQLISDIYDAREDALYFLKHGQVIPTGYAAIDKSLPRGGVRKGWLAMFLGKSGTGKTMMSTQLLSNMAEHGTRSIFFSLEQKKGQLYERIACQVLGRPPVEVEDLILAADPENAEIDAKIRDAAEAELQEVDRVFGHQNLFIVDNVPTDTVESVEMSAERIEAIIREINMTKFKDGGADVVIIDHLGILKPGDSAPRNVQNDEMQASGYIMERLFHVCKATDTFMLVLQQLPKEIQPGVLFAKDAGRGGSKQTDYCDLIFGAYRPEQEPGIEDDEKAARRGQYKLALLKNRYGAEEIAHLMFDTNSLRIVPAARVPMPDDDIADKPRVVIPGAEVLAPAAGAQNVPDELTVGLGEGPDQIDTHELAASLGLAQEESESGEVDFNGWEWGSDSA
jgi:DNA primase/KaiC/GvpD/RAD55 family RecA-like ATPase